MYLGYQFLADTTLARRYRHITERKPELDAGTLLVNGVATGSATTVFVVNEIADDKVAPTGIFIDNLPYILMVGIPTAVFGVMFANRLRKNAAA